MLRKDQFDEREEDFYEALYTQSQAQFDAYVQTSTVLNNYAHVFSLLVRLRQVGRCANARPAPPCSQCAGRWRREGGARRPSTTRTWWCTRPRLQGQVRAIRAALAAGRAAAASATTPWRTVSQPAAATPSAAPASLSTWRPPRPPPSAQPATSRSPSTWPTRPR